MRTRETAALPLKTGRWTLVSLLFAAMLINYVDRGNLAVAVPSLMREFGFSRSAAGLALAVFFWVYALVQLPAGWVVDHYRVRGVYAAGFALWCAVTAATGLVTGLAGLVAMRALLAAFESVSVPASLRAISETFAPDERGFPTGVYYAATKLGPAVGTALGAVLVASFGWRWLFAITGLAGLVWLGPWLRFRSWQSAPPQKKKAGAASLWAPFRLRVVWGIFLGFSCYGYLWHVYATWLPGYLVTERGMSLLQMGLWGSLPFLAFSATIPLAGFAADRLIARGWPFMRVRKSFVVAGLLVGMLIIAAAFVTTTLAAVALFTASAAGIGLATANIWTITQTLAPPAEVGVWVGIQNLGGSIGAGLAPLVTGILADRTGSFTAPLTLAGTLSAAGILCYVLLVHEIRHEKEISVSPPHVA